MSASARYYVRSNVVVEGLEWAWESGGLEGEFLLKEDTPTKPQQTKDVVEMEAAKGESSTPIR